MVRGWQGPKEDKWKYYSDEARFSCRQAYEVCLKGLAAGEEKMKYSRKNAGGMYKYFRFSRRDGQKKTLNIYYISFRRFRPNLVLLNAKMKM